MKIIKYKEEMGKKVLEDIEAACFNPPNFELIEYISDMSDSKNVNYLMEDEGKYVGLLSIYNWGSERNYVKITNIGVIPSYRKRNIASMLMKAMLSEMTLKGMKDFRAETRVTNFPMQKTFDKFNFKRQDRVENYYDDPQEDAYTYRLII